MAHEVSGRGTSDSTAAGAPAGETAGIGLAREVAQLLSDPLRLRILCELLVTPRNVTELQNLLSVPQPTVSHHLSLLLSGDLVTRRRAGRMAVYALGSRARGDGDSLLIEAGPLRVAWRVKCD